MLQLVEILFQNKPSIDSFFDVVNLFDLIVHSASHKKGKRKGTNDTKRERRRRKRVTEASINS